MSRKQWKKANHAVSQRTPDHTEFGPNEWLVDELHQQYLADKNSVDPAWWEFFADYQPSETLRGESSSTAGTNGAAADAEVAARAVPASASAAAPFVPAVEELSPRSVSDGW
jgi:2-oxoglutarate dehydrogenase E1 component